MWKKASKQATAAITAHHWTEAEDGYVWNLLKGLEKKNCAAFKKAEAAREALENFTRRMAQ